MQGRHCLYSLLLGLELVLAGPVRQADGAEATSTLNDVTFWKDPECLEVNGHMKWDGPNGQVTGVRWLEQLN